MRRRRTFPLWFQPRARANPGTPIGRRRARDCANFEECIDKMHPRVSGAAARRACLHESPGLTRISAFGGRAIASRRAREPYIYPRPPLVVVRRRVQTTVRLAVATGSIAAYTPPKATALLERANRSHRSVGGRLSSTSNEPMACRSAPGHRRTEWKDLEVLRPWGWLPSRA